MKHCLNLQDEIESFYILFIFSQKSYYQTLQVVYLLVTFVLIALLNLILAFKGIQECVT
jgi:hypothetical protein